jgi:hypothetical protein
MTAVLCHAGGDTEASSHRPAVRLDPPFTKPGPAQRPTASAPPRHAFEHMQLPRGCAACVWPHHCMTLPLSMRRGRERLIGTSLCYSLSLLRDASTGKWKCGQVHKGTVAVMVEALGRRRNLFFVLMTDIMIITKRKQVGHLRPAASTQALACVLPWAALIAHLGRYFCRRGIVQCASSRCGRPGT